MKVLSLAFLLVVVVVAEHDVHKGLLVAKDTTKSLPKEELKPVKRQIGPNFRPYISPSTTYGPPSQAFDNNGPIVEHIHNPFNTPIDNHLLELTKPRQFRKEQVIGRPQQIINPQSFNNAQIFNKQQRFINPQNRDNQQRFINPQSVNNQQRFANQQQSFNNPQQNPNNPQQSFNNPQQNPNNPQQSFNNPQQIFNNPQQNLNNPQQSFNNPQQSFTNPQIFNNPQQIINNPQQSFSDQQTFNNQQNFNNQQHFNSPQSFNPFSHEQRHFFLKQFNNKNFKEYFGQYTKPCDTHFIHHSRHHFNHNSPDNHFSPNSQEFRHPQLPYSGNNQFQGNQDRQFFNGVFNKIQEEPRLNEFNDNLSNDRGVGIDQDPKPDFSVVLA